WQEDRKQPRFSEHAGTCGVDDDGEPDDGQTNEDCTCGVDDDGEPDDGQTNDGEGDDVKAYEDVEEVMEEDKEDVEDVLEEEKEDVEDVLEEDKEDVEDVLDVAPLVARNQQTEAGHILHINPKYLYNLVIPFKFHSSASVVSEICGQIFTTNDCNSFGPRMRVGNTGILFGASLFMFFERRSTGVVRRICFSPLYADELQQFREQYVCQWILDAANVRRNQVLQDLGIL
ncbi:hypothetical protein V8G54_018925, partial [Vigna mungo]